MSNCFFLKQYINNISHNRMVIYSIIYVITLHLEFCPRPTMVCIRMPNNAPENNNKKYPLKQCYCAIIINLLYGVSFCTSNNINVVSWMNAGKWWRRVILVCLFEIWSMRKQIIAYCSKTVNIDNCSRSKGVILMSKVRKCPILVLYN